MRRFLLVGSTMVIDYCENIEPIQGSFATPATGEFRNLGSEDMTIRLTHREIGKLSTVRASLDEPLPKRLRGRISIQPQDLPRISRNSPCPCGCWKESKEMFWEGRLVSPS